MSPETSLIVPTRVNCLVHFGAPAAKLESNSTLQVSLPVLHGPRDETLLADAEASEKKAGYSLFRRESLLAGLGVASPGLKPEQAAADLYDRLFAVTGGLHLYRIWNYVPQINAIEDDWENYQSFCRGRSLAFERHFGHGFEKVLPSASAVGTTHGPLTLGFLAGKRAPSHVENPRQIPAFEYPPQYGPRAPSFARATFVPGNSDRKIFISGTAAIRGHATVAEGNLESQLTCTLANLELVAAAAGSGSKLGANQGWSRRFKVYLRHAADLTTVEQRLRNDLLIEADSVQYLQADICRAGLVVEIEAILTAAN